MLFDLQVKLEISFGFQESTIWPAVNKLTEEVDEIDAAADRLIAALEAKNGKAS